MKRIVAAALLTVAFAGFALTETPKPDEDPLARYLYAPEKILGHAQELGLSEAQRQMIREEVHRAQSRFLDLQFEMQPESEKLVTLVREQPVSETKVLAQVDRILALEKEIKKTHLSLLIRLKNSLTPAQLARLEEIQTESGK